MKDKWQIITESWQQLLDKAKGIWDNLTEAKSSKPIDHPQFINHKGATMNIKWNHVSGQWEQYRSKAKEQWGELTDSELIAIDGRFDALARKIEEKYGVERKEAGNQIDMWTANLII